jgi:hypothetical protein
MVTRPRPAVRERELRELLTRNNSLNGGVLFGLECRLVEIQARATGILKQPTRWGNAVELTGMATGAVREVLGRITGAFAKLQVQPRARGPPEAWHVA